LTREEMKLFLGDKIILTSTAMIKEIAKIVKEACKKETNCFGYGVWIHYILIDIFTFKYIHFLTAVRKCI